jgi:hypothetical protein
VGVLVGRSGGSTLKGAVLVGGPAVRYTSPFALAVKQKPRRDVLCPRAAPAPDEEAARARTITKAQTHFRGINPP